MEQVQFVLLLLLTTLVAGFPTGSTTCIVEPGYGESQTPQGPKGSTAMSGRIFNSGVGPVIWNTSATSYSPDTAVPITIKGDTFIGFVLTAVASGTSTRLAGTFSMSDSSKINTAPGWPSDCNGKAATHSGFFGSQSEFVVNFQIAAPLTFSTQPTVVEASYPAQVTVSLATTGTVYWALLAQGQAQPTAAQIRNAAGITPAPRSFGTTTIVTAATATPFNITDLDETTPYDLYLLGEQTSGATLTNINFLSYAYRQNSNFHYNLNVCPLPPANPKPTTVTVKLSFTSGTGTPRTPQNVSFTLSPSTVNFGSGPITLSATATSGLTKFTYTSSNQSVAQISGNVLTLTGTGTSNITAIQPGDSTWARTAAIQTLTVNKGSQKITFPGSLSTTINVGDLLPLFANIDSGLPITFSVPTNQSVATIIDGTILNATAAGTVVLTATNAGNGNYTAATNTTTITVQVLAPPATDVLRFTIDLQGALLPAADSPTARTKLITALSTQAGIDPARLSIVSTKTSDQDINATTYTVDLSPAVGQAPSSEAALTNITNSAADPQSFLSTTARADGLTVLSVLPPGFYYGLVVNGKAYKYNMYLALDGGFELYWLLNPTSVSLALRKQTNGWIAFGWAYSQSAPYMVGSSVTVGFNTATNKQAADYYLGDENSAKVVPSSGQNITQADSTYVNGFTTLVWTRPFAPSGGAISVNPEILQTVIYASQTPAPSSGPFISRHDPSGRYPIRLNLRTGETAAAAADPKKSAHAALMWLGWGFFLPLGLIMARFGKPLPCKIMGVPIWFQTHRSFQMTGLALAIAAWIIGIFYIGSGTQTTHRGIGYFVMIVGCLQPLNALIRPHPPQPGQEPTRERRAWFWTHAWLGRSAVILGIVNMFIGIDILEPGDKYVGLLAASVVILGVLFVVLQIQQWFFPPQKATTEPKETPMDTPSS